jgi:hypothetical protein
MIFFIIFIILQIATSICSFIALFTQTSEFFPTQTTFLEKLLHNEFWISLQWAFAIPGFRIGLYKTGLTVPQIFLFGYVVGFLTEIIIDKYFFQSMTIDHYVAITFLLTGLAISKYF